MKVIEAADRYPEQRSVPLPYADLDLFDPDFAAHMLERPVKTLFLAREAVRKLVPPGKEGSEVLLRITGLPRDSRIEIRKLRSEHLGKLVSVEGLVRKATEVRPKVVDAYFQCARCGGIVREPQEGMVFKEPMECYKDQNGCGRSASSTKFKLLTEDSRFVDTQKIEIQENPEGLRGGAQPERLAGFLEEDLAGKVAPGDRLILNGILRSVQKGSTIKSTLFDINLDVLSVEFKEHEYEEVSISPEDEMMIQETARSPELFSKIVSSISPSIYGYETEKLAIALQLFGGVHKALDDGTKIRGDIHILLVGDPGVAKCVTSDTLVTLANGTTRPIGVIVEEAMQKGPVEKVDDGFHAPLDLPVLTFSQRGCIEPGPAIRAWKRDAPRKLVKVTTDKGKALSVTLTHPLFVQNGPWIQSRAASKLFVGQHIAVATGPGEPGPDETHGTKRGMAWEKIVSLEQVPAPEDFVYDLEVEETHNFVTNGILSHNSQMLRYMAELAPRGIYASGKSSSAAGLCVAPDTLIRVDGQERRIKDVVEPRLIAPKEIKPGQWASETNGIRVDSQTFEGRMEPRPVKAVWRIDTPSFLVEIITKTGDRIALTAETRIFAKRAGMAPTFARCSDLRPGEEVIVRDRSGAMVWSAIAEKRQVDTDLPPHVYDLTVDGSHCFVANDFLVHNTAAAVKDEFGEGRWTLEAGALVLADLGIACVDGEQTVIAANGVLKIRDVEPGTKIINYDNGRHIARVKRVIDKGLKECKDVRLYSGDHIVCTPDHKLLTDRGWKEAAELKEGDFVKIPFIADNHMRIEREGIEYGFLHGFMLSDCYYIGEEDNHKIWFSAAKKNSDRSDYVDRLARHIYGRPLKSYKKKDPTVMIRGKEVEFGEVMSHSCTGLEARADLRYVLDSDMGPYSDPSYRIGFLAGIMSTACCVSHKKGPNGIKHTIEMAVGREAYDDEWLNRKCVLVMSMLHSLGILAVRRRRKIYITSLRSYNRAVGLIGPYVVGKNRRKLYRVEPNTRIQSFDDILDGNYHDWFASVKFHTSATVNLGLHSRIWMAIRYSRVTETLMETLRPFWPQITDEPFREPNKDYLLNRVMGVSNAGWRHVYDLTIEGEPNFLVNGGIVHNCVDELDKMEDQDRSSMHEAMESQCYDEETEVLTDHGWKLFADVKLDDLVASLTDCGRQFVQPTTYVQSCYDGPMHYLQSGSLDIAVTPNHNMYISIRDDKGRWSDYGLVRMDQIPPDARIRFKVSDTRQVGFDMTKARREDYSGKIFCVEVPDHVIFVRRNKKPVWCGNTISVAKAGISARLQCRCSILGAANPKYGRFEEHQFIADQIDLPPALMSRFDLIFAMTDKPDHEKDMRITRHILAAHRRGEMLQVQEKNEEETKQEEQIVRESQALMPALDREFFRKYVAYSKRTVPVLSDEAVRLITEYYLQIRKQGEGEGKSVPITARQLEAYVRLSEASARARLSRVVTKDDAQRAVDVVEYYLKKIAGEAGRLDIDIIATGVSKSQREQTVSLKDIMATEADREKGISLESLITAADQRGIPEERVRILLKRLKENGEIYEPSSGYYKLAIGGNE